MLDLSRIVGSWLGWNGVAEWAQRVAGRSRAVVWDRVSDRLTALGPTEARGYIRARAALVVQSEAQRLIEQEGQKLASIRPQIEALAIQYLLEGLTTQLGQRLPTQATRRAA
jgi:hypothetical protein